MPTMCCASLPPAAPELAASDKNLIEAALNGGDDGVALAREIAERMADVLDALDERLTATGDRA